MIAWYVDPGEHVHSFACYLDGLLVHVWQWPADFRTTEYPTGRLVIERPEVYPAPQPSRADDQVRLAMAAADAGAKLQAAGAPAPVFVLPREWKGQTPKPIHHRRVWSVLGEHERDVFAYVAGYTETEIVTRIELACAHYARTRKVRRYSWKAHNLLDAVGLGLWDLKRMGAGVRR